METNRDMIRKHLMDTTREVGPVYKIVFAALLCLILLGAFAWFWQLSRGLTVTGMNTSVCWGIYIINFVFFIGLSHAGTLISAILRLLNSESRRAITRVAETITLISLLIGVSQIIIDMGHPERLLNLILYGRLQSAVLWDIISVSVYFLTSFVYLYLSLIPDIAIMREHLPPDAPSWRKKLYKVMSLSWEGGREQKRRLEQVIRIMAVVILCVAVSVHTVISWLFAMTLRPMWHSTIFGPYFVTGAIFSGIAVLIITMTIFRKALHLEAFWRRAHFRVLGKILILMAALWFYFIFAEHLTAFYGGMLSELKVFHMKLLGEYAAVFWVMVFCMGASLGVLVFGKKTPILACAVASVFVIIGMWLERFQIIVPTLTRPLQEGYKMGFYTPTWVELSLTLASFAAFIMGLMIFVKLFPIISIWEVWEGERGLSERASRIEAYLPEMER